MDKLRAYAQLLRIPNVFTAMADVCMGWMVAHSFVSQWPLLARHNDLIEVGLLRTRNEDLILLGLLLGCTSCLYSAGMVWNDFFDAEEDRQHRPFRPIPSGRVTRRAAGILGTVLLVVGIGFAGTCHLLVGWRPLILAGLLAAAVLLYDSWLKRTWLGPVGMGLCRFLNVLLGLSREIVIVEDWWILGMRNHDPPRLTDTIDVLAPWLTIAEVWLASIVGVYIAGVTWFAQTEAVESNRVSLRRAASVIGIAGIMALAQMAAAVVLLPSAMDELTLAAMGDESLAAVLIVCYSALLMCWALFIGRRIDIAIRNPQPQQVQAAVKRCIFGLVFLDAALAFGAVGLPGLFILLLLLPALLLGRWVYST